MSDLNTFEQEFIGQNYTENPLAVGEYEACIFSSCIFAKADLRNIKFTDCTFDECDFTMANVFETGIRSCTFNTCKMLGIEFHEIKSFLFALKANDCILNHCSFTNLDLKKCAFTNCKFEESNFEGANLSGSDLNHCDFLRASFINTDLRKSNLSTCINLFLDPDKNLISKASFSKENLIGLLGKYDIKVV